MWYTMLACAANIRDTFVPLKSDLFMSYGPRPLLFLLLLQGAKPYITSAKLPGWPEDNSLIFSIRGPTGRISAVFPVDGLWGLSPEF